MTKLVLINGPIGCGKTKAVKSLKELYPFVERRCKDKLFKLTMEFFCVSEDRFWEIYNSRELKEKPLPEFTITSLMYDLLKGIIDGEEPQEEFIEISCRSAMIYISEVVCKTTFGNDYFGVARAKDTPLAELSIDDSCGFAAELPPIIEKIGQDNILLIRVHGRGTFDGDSRAYIESGVINNTVDIYNDADERSFLANIGITVSKFLEGN